MINNEAGTQFTDYQLIVRLLYSNQLPRVFVTYYSLVNLQEILANSSIDLTFDKYVNQLINNLDHITAEQMYHIMANHKNSLLYVAIKKLPVIYFEVQSSSRASNAGEKGMLYDVSTFSFVLPASLNITPTIGDFIRLEWYGKIQNVSQLDLQQRLYVVKSIEADYFLEASNLLFWKVTATINPRYSELFQAKRVIDTLTYSQLQQIITSAEKSTSVSLILTESIQKATNRYVLEDLYDFVKLLYTRSYQYNLYVFEYAIRHSLIKPIAFDIIPQIVSKFSTDFSSSKEFLKYTEEVINNSTFLTPTVRSYLKAAFNLLELNEQTVKQFIPELQKIDSIVGSQLLVQPEKCVNIVDCKNQIADSCIQAAELRQFITQRLNAIQNNLLQYTYYSSQMNNSIKLLLKVLDSYTSNTLQALNSNASVNQFDFDQTILDALKQHFSNNTTRLYNAIYTTEQTNNNDSELLDSMTQLLVIYYTNLFIASITYGKFYKIYAAKLIDELHDKDLPKDLKTQLNNLQSNLQENDNELKRLLIIVTLLTLAKFYLPIKDLAKVFLESLMDYFSDEYSDKLSAYVISWLDEQLDGVTSNNMGTLKYGWLITYLLTIEFAEILALAVIYKDSTLTKLLLTNDFGLQYIIAQAVQRIVNNSLKLEHLVAADYIFSWLTNLELGTLAKAITLDKIGIAKFNAEAVQNLVSPLLVCAQVFYNVAITDNEQQEQNESDISSTDSSSNENSQQQEQSSDNNSGSEEDEPIIL